MRHRQEQTAERQPLAHRHRDLVRDEHGLGRVDLARQSAGARDGRGEARGARRERRDHGSRSEISRRYCWSMMFSENRYPLFGIMLYCVAQVLAIAVFTRSSAPSISPSSCARMAPVLQRSNTSRAFATTAAW